MGAAGETRRCPHCGEQVLASAGICPQCQRRLRVGATAPVPPPAAPTLCPLSVDGIIRHPGEGGEWEYTVMVEIQDAQGSILARRVIGVGAMQPGEVRKIALRIEVRVPEMAGLAVPS
jgi:hypothetical protein